MVETFWNVRGVGLFYALSAIALVIFATGVSLKVATWVAARPAWSGQRVGDGLKQLVVNGLGNRRIFKDDPYAGAMHLFLMWGFLTLFAATITRTIDDHIVHLLTGNTLLVFSFLVDLGGMGFILGVITAALRRFVLKSGRMSNLWDDPFLLAFLFGIAGTGFLLEGLRLTALQPPANDWRLGGAAVSWLLDGNAATAELWYGWLWWVHAAFSLSLVAYFPFSKLFHALGGSTNLYLSTDQPRLITMEEREKLPQPRSLQQIVSLDACVRCNRCENACPAFALGEPLSPREFVQRSWREMQRSHGWLMKPTQVLSDKAADPSDGRTAEAEKNAEAAWFCSACRACVEECPLSVKPMELIRETRVGLVEEGRQVPANIRKTLQTVGKYGNPWDAASKRRQWLRDLQMKDLSAGDEADLCYFVSCLASDDAHNQQVVQAFSSLLQQAGVDFATLGKEESCCGEYVRRIGEDGLFEALVEGNYATFASFGVKSLVTTSPHCYHTFKNEYPILLEKLRFEEAQPFTVQHHTELLADLLGRGQLHLSQPVNARVTFHDPCFLGRHNGQFEAPRRVLNAIPGIQLVEMPRSRINSFCCGGGGGRMWMESEADERMADVRLREALTTKADILVTSCPFCLSNFQEAVKTNEEAQRLKVMDIAEVVYQALAVPQEEKHPMDRSEE